MSIIDTIKRLERARSGGSRAGATVRQAAADVARFIMDSVPIGSDLPRGYGTIERRSSTGGSATFLVSPPGDPDECGNRVSHYINGWDGYLHGDFRCELREPSRECVLDFARDIAEGLLDEIAAWLDARAAEDEAAAAQLEAAKVAAEKAAE